MTADEDMKELRTEIVDRIRDAAAAQEDPAGFIQALQVDIEDIPGAMVAFATRDVARLDNLAYFDDAPNLSLEEKQEVLVRAAGDYEEPFGSEDAISHQIDICLSGGNTADTEST